MKLCVKDKCLITPARRKQIFQIYCRDAQMQIIRPGDYPILNYIYSIYCVLFSWTLIYMLHERRYTVSIWKESFLAALHCLLIKDWCFIDAKLGKNSRNPTPVENGKKKTLFTLNYFISYHPTKKLSRNIPFEKQNSFSHIHGCVCIDTKRIVSDGCRAQMAVSHDGVESLQHVARRGGFLHLWEELISPHRGQGPLTQNPAVVGQVSTGMGLKMEPTAAAWRFSFSRWTRSPRMACTQAGAKTTAHICGTNGHWQQRPILALTSSLCLHQSEIGFGKLETYIKLDKLGEVR